MVCIRCSMLARDAKMTSILPMVTLLVNSEHRAPSPREFAPIRCVEGYEGRRRPAFAFTGTGT